MGVQQQSGRRSLDVARAQRLLTAGGVAVAVAGVLVFLIEKFYDPEARARERAIAAEVTRMAEQQKVTDDLTLIEVDIENAIMNNEVDQARTLLASSSKNRPTIRAANSCMTPSTAPPNCRSSRAGPRRKPRC